jgi:hypothetical protein
MVSASGAPDNMFGLCVQFVCYVDPRMATTESRKFKTPFEISYASMVDTLLCHSAQVEAQSTTEEGYPQQSC